MRLAVVVFLVVVGFTLPARATVVGCRDYQHGKVWLRHCVNHDYYSRHLDLSLPIEARAMEKLRRALVAAKRIEDRPILVQHPPWPSITARIARAATCEPASDDSGQAPAPLQHCYLVDTTGRAPDWATFRTMLAGLGTLSSSRPEREVADLALLAKETGAAQLTGIVEPGPTVTSPDGKRSASVRFRDGRYEIAVGTKRIATVSELHPGMMFSPDSRRFAWATRERVTVLEPSGEQRTLELAGFYPGSSARHLVRLRFDGDAVEVVADRDLLSNYAVVRWSLPVDAAAIVQEGLGQPGW